VVVGQHLAEGGHADAPVPRHARGFLQARADAHFGDTARPVLAARAALVAEAAQIAAAVVADVAETRDVEAAGAASGVIPVLETVDDALRAGLEVMVHDVVAQLAGRRPQPALPHVG